MLGLTKKHIMESTFKIATSSRGVHGVPVIKIVQPKHLVNPDAHQDIDDVKDELISSLLHTPAMRYPNDLFRVDSRFTDENNGIRTTIISAVEEGQMIHTFKHSIFARLIAYENLCECVELYREFEDGIIPKGTVHKAPYDYDRFLKITEFFDWVWQQTYNGDPVNTPIETRRDTKTKPTVIPMEIVRDYFELSLNQDERIKAFENTPKIKLNKKVENIWDAINSAFNPQDTPEGEWYWQNVVNRINLASAQNTKD